MVIEEEQDRNLDKLSGNWNNLIIKTSWSYQNC